MNRKNFVVLAIPFLLFLLVSNSDLAVGQEKGEWIQLFNGKNLENWEPKFTGYDLGYNLNNTFRVEDGILRVSYDDWEEWGSEYGHLFYKTEQFSHYILRVEYRFTGEQVPGGPGWAFRNNGLMLHSQAPELMGKNQEFPVSIETQLLGGNGRDERTTLNVCTPSTNIVMNDELITQHCINSGSETYHGDQWVTAEIEVRGSKLVKHKVRGEVVFEYTAPQLDERDEDAQKLIKAQNKKELLLEKGYITIQAESHPTEFRKLNLRS